MKCFTYYIQRMRNYILYNMYTICFGMFICVYDNYLLFIVFCLLHFVNTSLYRELSCIVYRS